jgi:hypothetical protein
VTPPGYVLLAGPSPAFQTIIYQPLQPPSLRLGGTPDMAPMTLCVCGTAQTPQTLPWKQNEGGPLSPEDALPLSEEHGVSFPEEVRIHLVIDLPIGTYAAYLLPTTTYADDLWRWERFLNRFGEIPLRLAPTVLESDEAIVAVFAHEAYELNALRVRLPDGEAITALELRKLVATGIEGNLHCQAWDDADRRITEWRQKTGPR